MIESQVYFTTDRRSNILYKLTIHFLTTGKISIRQHIKSRSSKNDRDLLIHLLQILKARMRNMHDPFYAQLPGRCHISRQVINK
jgi:hypothetical protein